jgi:hypothetical protein
MIGVILQQKAYLRCMIKIMVQIDIGNKII